MLGAMLVLIKNMLRNVVKDPERLEAQTGVPVIATIPRSPLLTRLRKNKKSPNRLLAHADNNGLSYEAIKSLRTNLMFGMDPVAKSGQRAKVILITGESPGVGKSFISSNLSEVFAQLNNKILIIDADMRLGELHKMFNMDHNNGLGDYLSLTKEQNQIISVNELKSINSLEPLFDDIAEYIHPTGMDNIDFMPRGQHPRNPASLLASNKFVQLMANISEHYDYIIIDTAPCGVVADASILSSYADGILLVVRNDMVASRRIKRAVENLENSGTKLVGCIYNDTESGMPKRFMSSADSTAICRRSTPSKRWPLRKTGRSPSSSTATSTGSMSMMRVWLPLTSGFCSMMQLWVTLKQSLLPV